jgi:hypothetical protein
LRLKFQHLLELELNLPLIITAKQATMKLPSSRGSKEASQQLVELEKRVHEFVENQGKTPCSAQVCKRADEIARDLGMSSFKSSVAWYTKFTKRISGRERTAPKPKEQPKGVENGGRPLADRSKTSHAEPALAVPASEQGGGAASSEHGMAVSASSPLLVSAPGRGSTAHSNSDNIPLQQGAQMQQGQHQLQLNPHVWGGERGPGGQQHALHSQAMQHLGENLHLQSMQSSLAMQHQTLQHALYVQQQQRQHEAGVQAQWEQVNAALAIGPMRSGGPPFGIAGSMAASGMAAALAAQPQQGALAAYTQQRHVHAQAALQHRMTGGCLAGVEPSHQDTGSGGAVLVRCSLNVKASLRGPSTPSTPSTLCHNCRKAVHPNVMRRLRVILDLDGQGIPINGHGVITYVLASAFKDELEAQGQSVASPIVGLTYLDEDGDDIVISSNHELGIAIHYAMREHQAQPSAAAADPTLRLTIHYRSPHHAQPLSMHPTIAHSYTGSAEGSAADALTRTPPPAGPNILGNVVAQSTLQSTPGSSLSLLTINT